VLRNYGQLHDGVSRLRLKYHGELEDLNADVIGTLASTDDPTLLHFEIDRDTLPTNTVAHIDRIINTNTARPGFNGFPAPQLGQRYLCAVGLDDEGVNYFGIDFDENDIIEYNGSDWVVSFDASEFDRRAYVTNTTTLQQLKFEDGSWSDTYQGIYEGGYWRLELLDEGDE
jgi:hypothetical protein